ncbi:MAG TPA: cyclic nucleotide-binding domain-containing protein [Candidatus Dormibacteraeota bacterium]|jgi:Flp pilus assembly CpaE family ATPase
MESKVAKLDLPAAPSWERSPRVRLRSVAPPEFAGPPRRRRRSSNFPSPSEIAAGFNVLEQASVFYSMPDGILRSIARRLRILRVPKGSLITSQNEAGDCIFFVAEGRCQLAIERAAGHRVAVAVLAEGDFFGEAACVLHETHQASAVALADCKLLALDRTSLFAVISQSSAEIALLSRLAQQRKAAFAETAAQASWGVLLGEAPVVAVYSPKGGSGGTTVALNLVGALSRRYPGQVLLLDLDLPYNHAALLANLVPTTCLARAAQTPPEAFEEVLLSAVLYHAGGPMILPGALKPEEADLVTPELLARTISVLRRSFRYVIVDLGVALSESVLAIVDHVQHVVLVVTPEISAVKASADALEILVALGVPPDEVSVLLNHRSAKPAVLRASLERMLGKPVDVEMLFDGGRPDEAALHGNILSLTDPRSEVTKGVEALARRLESTQPLAAVVGGSPSDLASQPGAGDSGGLQEPS